MIAQETSNRFKKLLITDKCQQKLGTTDYSPHWPKSAELQSTDNSQD